MVRAILDGVPYWKCGSCGIYKPESDYYTDGKTVAGVASVCKKCHCAGSIRTRDKDNARELNVEHMRRARQNNTEKFRARERESSRERRILSPEKIAARAMLNNAVKRGDVNKPKACEECGVEGRLTGHHADYSKPLDVKWLCYKCHGKTHRVVEFKRIP